MFQTETETGRGIGAGPRGGEHFWRGGAGPGREFWWNGGAGRGLGQNFGGMAERGGAGETKNNLGRGRVE